MILTITRIIKTAYQHILRNAKLSLASTLIMTLTFFVSSLFLVALFGAGLILNYFEGQSQIIVFFNPDIVTDAFVLHVETVVKNQHVPVQITKISKEQAYKIFVNYLNQDNPGLSQSVNMQKLPPSLEIKTNNIDDLQKIATVLYSVKDQSNVIDNILYYKNVENFLKEFIRVIRLAAIVFISFLAGISILIVWITIGIALNSHADEIEIMQLVGATRAYIEIPFILEGAVYGVVGAILSIGFVAALIAIVTHFYTATYISLLSYFKGIPIPHVTVISFFTIFLLEVLIGALIGSIGSYVAIRSKLR